MTCPPTLPMLEQVAERFAAVAHVRPVMALVDGSDVDAARSCLTQQAPDAVVAFPRPADALAQAGVVAPVLPVDFPADILLGRVEAAFEQATEVAVLPPAGCVSPAAARLLGRLGTSVHVFPYETHAQLRDLVIRCRRMGVKALVGSENARVLAGEAGLVGVSLVDGPDESAGVMAQAIVRAAVQAAPRHAARCENLARYRVILEKIAQGAIGPRDTALCVDRQGRVTATFAPPAANGTRALPAGISILEAVAATSPTSFDGEPASLALDLYPLTVGAGGSFLAVLRATARPAATLGGESGAADLGEPRLTRLLERVDALIERTDAPARARRAPRRFLASLRRRTFLLDWNRVRFFELRSGLVYASLATGETYATNYSLADIVARVDARDFFRIHRNVIVNLNYVTELERYGVSQLRVVIGGSDTPAFVVSRPASAALRRLFKY